tara:strand:+ start:3323 stop:3613 length:291 start_codon:yes stop_codon:yes gene_type:complete
MQSFTFNQRVENLFKSYFSTYENISILLNEEEIKIYLLDKKNLDSASLESIKLDQCYQIIFWDGYSQSEIIEVFNERDAAKTLKRFMKKLIKILDR